MQRSASGFEQPLPDNGQQCLGLFPFFGRA